MISASCSHYDTNKLFAATPESKAMTSSKALIMFFLFCTPAAIVIYLILGVYYESYKNRDFILLPEDETFFRIPISLTFCIYKVFAYHGCCGKNECHPNSEVQL